MNAAAVAAERPVIHLELHAYPTIRVQGRRVDLPLKGGLALIARLAAEPGRLSRAAAAAALLWPDADAGLGRGRLRRLMHDVNRRLGVGLIAGDTDAVWLDAARFELHCDRSDALRLAHRVLQHGELTPEEASRCSAEMRIDCSTASSSRPRALPNGWIRAGANRRRWSRGRSSGRSGAG